MKYCASVAESVYAADLKSADSQVMWVQVPSLVLNVVEILHFFIKISRDGRVWLNAPHY